MNVTIDNILDEVAKYSVNDKEMIVRIIEKRLIDEKRNLLYRKYKKAEKDYKSGKIKTGSSEDLLYAFEEAYYEKPGN